MPLPTYDELRTRLRRVHLLGTVSDLLGWDEQVNLPAGAAEQRAAQQALLAELHRDAAAVPETGGLLAELEAGPLDPDQAAVVREARKEYDRVSRLPAEFVREKAAHCSRAFHAWAEARQRGDFAAYAPVLEKHLDLARQEAAYLGKSAAPYDYFIDQHDPGMTAVEIGALFAELKEGLVPLVRRITTSPIRPPAEALHGFSVAKQEKFLREVVGRLGFDFRHGRIDVSLHPFCSGTGTDTRMTTRFDRRDPLKSLFGAIHETGHGLYEQGLALEHAGSALGQHAGMAVHESQSRLWENQVGRGRPFWRFFGPRLRALFPQQMREVSDDALHLAINAVRPTQIRVDADEVTYNLHIILRFELEQALFRGDLQVRDLPAAWTVAARELLGGEPKDDREGVLQDVHWSGGEFGYFPSYCLGNMLAAQLWYRAQQVLPGLEEDFERGEFSRLLAWLRTEVHSRGRRLGLSDLAREVTGEEFSPRSLLRYLRERYGPIYGVGTE